MHKIGKIESPLCVLCDLAEQDGAAHTLLICSLFQRARQGAEAQLGQSITEDNLVEIMLSTAEAWNIVKNLAETIKRKKESLERARRFT